MVANSILRTMMVCTALLLFAVAWTAESSKFDGYIGISIKNENAKVRISEPCVCWTCQTYQNVLSVIIQTAFKTV